MKNGIYNGDDNRNLHYSNISKLTIIGESYKNTIIDAEKAETIFTFGNYLNVIAYFSVFFAMGRGKEVGVLNVSRQGIFFLPLIVVLPKFLGLDGIIYAQPAADVLSVLLTFALVRHNKDKLPLY